VLPKYCQKLLLVQTQLHWVSNSFRPFSELIKLWLFHDGLSASFINISDASGALVFLMLLRLR
jgi:hypothetical protein